MIRIMLAAGAALAITACGPKADGTRSAADSAATTSSPTGTMGTGPGTTGAE